MSGATHSGWEALSAGATWQGRRLHDRAAIERFLRADRVYAAFALGDLEPGYYEQTRWYGAQTAGELRSLALIYEGLEPPALFLMGDPLGIALLLGSLVRDRFVYATFLASSQPALETHYVLGEIHAMKRMALHPERFRPDRRQPVERLGPGSVTEMRELLTLDGGGATFFNAEETARGVFYGARRGGRLIAVAGTHLTAPAQRVAAVGNVFTHPAYRGQGYASACASRVTEELMGRKMMVVLNVRVDNAPAIQVYERLGYVEHGPFLEAPATRRSAP